MLGACPVLRWIDRCARAVWRGHFRASGATAWAVYSVATAVVVAVGVGAASSAAERARSMPAAAGLLQRVATVAVLAWIAGLAAARALFAPTGPSKGAARGRRGG